MKEIIALSEKSIVLKRNELLKVRGSIDTNIYFVESGSLKMYVENEETEQIIRFGYTNNLIVSLDSFLSGLPSDFCIQAIKKTTLKIITKSQLNAFLKDPKNQLFWINVLENVVLQQIEREKDILSNSPKERIERVLERSPQLFQEIPERHIANYLRMTPETLSRLKKTLI